MHLNNRKKSTITSPPGLLIRLHLPLIKDTSLRKLLKIPNSASREQAVQKPAASRPTCFNTL
jgi:hypothetical protein